MIIVDEIGSKNRAKILKIAVRCVLIGVCQVVIQEDEFGVKVRVIL